IGPVVWSAHRVGPCRRSCAVKGKDPNRLLHDPYTPPALHVGDRTTCRYRDAEVVIASWTDARIPWPRCQALETRGGSGLLITEELVRAIRTESAEAIKYWFGVGEAHHQAQETGALLEGRAPRYRRLTEPMARRRLISSAAMSYPTPPLV